MFLARCDVILDSVGGNLKYFSNKQGISCKRSTYVTLMPPMLEYVDESGLGLGLLRSAGTFFGMALKQVSVLTVSCGKLTLSVRCAVGTEFEWPLTLICLLDTLITLYLILET